MGKPVTRMVKVIDAKFFPTSRAFALLLEDLETHKQFRPVEVTPRQFGLSDSMPINAYENFAEALKGRKDPIKFVFEGDEQATDKIKDAIQHEANIIDGNITNEIKRGGEMLEDVLERAKKDDSFIVRQMRERD